MCRLFLGPKKNKALFSFKKKMDFFFSAQVFNKATMFASLPFPSPENLKRRQTCRQKQPPIGCCCHNPNNICRWHDKLTAQDNEIIAKNFCMQTSHLRSRPPVQDCLNAEGECTCAAIDPLGKYGPTKAAGLCPKHDIFDEEALHAMLLYDKPRA